MIHGPQSRQQTEQALGVAAHVVARRKVRPAGERLAIRREPHRQRPAAASAQHVHRGHVQAVHVGPLLAIDLDCHVMPIQVGGDLHVLERFARHDVAPMAGRITDGQQDGFVFARGAGERLVPPGVPVDRIVGVLAQIRAGFENQAVGVARASVGPYVPGARRRGVCGGALQLLLQFFGKRGRSRQPEHFIVGRRVAAEDEANEDGHGAAAPRGVHDTVAPFIGCAGADASRQRRNRRCQFVTVPNCWT